jgi:AmmeMemoRadiSam system protein B
LDLSSAKRVFILGPSHYLGLRNCALTTFEEWETRFGNLVVDETILSELQSTGKFSEMPRSIDIEEHSLEMHIPYLWKRLEQTHDGDIDKWPTIVPILVGSTSRRVEKMFGSILLPYLKDPQNAFIVSSDFCHWGQGFSYCATFSVAAAHRRIEAEKRRVEAEERRRLKKEAGETDEGEEEEIAIKEKEPVKLVSKGGTEPWPILVSALKEPRGEGDMAYHESIKILDDQAIAAIETGVHDNFLNNLAETGNTVCGRHPIGVMMAALEEWRHERVLAELERPTGGGGGGLFKFVRYARSCEAETLKQSSVSYVSAYAIP